MDKVRNHSIFVETNLTIIYSGINTLVSIIFFGYAARICDISNFGLELQIITAAGAMAGLLDFGTTYFYLRELSSGRVNAKTVLGALIGRSIIILICTAPIAIFGLISSRMYLIEFVLLLNAQMLLQFTSIILRANGNTSILSRSMLLERSFSLVVLIALLNYDQNPPFSLVIACTTLIVSIIQIYSSFTAIKFKDLVNYIVWNPWHNSLGIGSTQVLSQIQQLDLNLLALLSNTTSAATYGAVSRWTNAMGVFAGGFSQSIIPSASRESFDKSEIRELRKASVWLVMAILSSILIYIFASRIVAIVLGTKYSDSAGILRVLAVAAVASTFTQPIATYLQAKGLNLQVFRALITGIVLQILMIVVTNSSLGAYSAAYGYLIGQFVAAILLLNSFVGYKRKRSINLL